MTTVSLNSTGDLILTVKENGTAKDVSNASTVNFLIKKPDLTVVEVTAAFNTDGTDGKVKYTFLSTDLTLEGQYEVQVKLTGIPWSGQSNSYEFEVGPTLVAS